MAVPQLAAPAGAMTVKQMTILPPQQNQMAQIMKPLEDLLDVNKLQAILLKGILDTQKQFLAQLALLKDAGAEELSLIHI